MTGTCTRCGRTRELARRDLCRACYQILWRAGTLPPCPPLPEKLATCTHGHHEHGTRAMYVWDRCRCNACRAANSRDQKRNAHAVAHGERALIDPTPVRIHLEQLAAAGMGKRQIAETAGVSRSTLAQLRDATLIRRSTAARLLAVTAVTHAPHDLVDATGTVRRLRALVAFGYSIANLSERLASDVYRIITADRVLEATRAAVARLYDELSNTPPETRTGPQRASVSRSRAYAKARLWGPPMVWDDESIDDPEAEPATLAAERPLSTRDQVLELLDLGVSVTEMPHRIGKDWTHIMYSIRDAELRALLRARAIDAGMVPPPAIVEQPRRRRAAA